MFSLLTSSSKLHRSISLGSPQTIAFISAKFNTASSISSIVLCGVFPVRICDINCCFFSIVWSGKKATLLLLPPQRTVRESFPSYGSSFYKVLSFLKTRLNSSKVFSNNKGVLNNYFYQLF